MDSAGRRAKSLSIALVCLVLAAGCGRSGEGAEETSTTSTTEAVTTRPAAPSTSTTTTAPQQLTYVIQSGDSLSLIAQRFGISTEDLANFNAISDANAIQVGQELSIPPTTIASATTSTVAADETTTTVGE